jgi:hypothetical protein
MDDDGREWPYRGNEDATGTMGDDGEVKRGRREERGIAKERRKVSKR